MRLTRRSLFRMLAGAAIAPFIPKPLLALAAPEFAAVPQVPMRVNHIALVDLPPNHPNCRCRIFTSEADVRTAFGPQSAEYAAALFFEASAC